MANERKTAAPGTAPYRRQESWEYDVYREIHSCDPGLTPGSAEGDEETVEKALHHQEEAQKRRR